MSAKIDLTGQRFGRLTVIEEAGRVNGTVTWRCRCDCGNESIVLGTNLRAGYSTSCGCYTRERAATENTRHGGRHDRLYAIWTGMRQRCNNPNSQAYKDYGGRGITVCPEWDHNFAAFRDWALANGYRADLSIDRVDNNGGYRPDNCRWATWHEQRINQRPRKKKTT